MKASLKRTVTGAPQHIESGDKVVTLPPRPISLDRIKQQITDARSNCVQIEIQDEQDRAATEKQINEHRKHIETIAKKAQDATNVQLAAIETLRRERFERSNALRASHEDATRALLELQEKAAHDIRNNMDMSAEPRPRHPLPPVGGT